MLKEYCDRCERDITHENTTKVKMTIDDKPANQVKDLCPWCALELKKWINQTKTK